MMGIQSIQGDSPRDEQRDNLSKLNQLKYQYSFGTVKRSKNENMSHGLGTILMSHFPVIPMSGFEKSLIKSHRFCLSFSSSTF